MYDKRAKFERLSKMMMKLQTEARSLWHVGKEEEAILIADKVSRLADIRIKYIPNDDFMLVNKERESE